MRCNEAFSKFVTWNSEEPLMFPMLVTVSVRDLYLREIKKYAAPTMTLKESKHRMIQRVTVEEA